MDTNSPDLEAFRATAPGIATRVDDTSAVLISHGQVVVGLSIAQARELSMALARAADEAELKLPQ